MFLFSTLEGVLDEDGQLLRAREHDELIAFGRAQQLLACTPHAARVIDVHTGEVSATIDLRPIIATLIPPVPPRVPASR